MLSADAKAPATMRAFSFRQLMTSARDCFSAGDPRGSFRLDVEKAWLVRNRLRIQPVDATPRLSL
jgi:hypothetical protein